MTHWNLHELAKAMNFQLPCLSVYGYTWTTSSFVWSLLSTRWGQSRPWRLLPQHIGFALLDHTTAFVHDPWKSQNERHPSFTFDQSSMGMSLCCWMMLNVWLLKIEDVKRYQNVSNKFRSWNLTIKIIKHVCSIFPGVHWKRSVRCPGLLKSRQKEPLGVKVVRPHLGETIGARKLCVPPELRIMPNKLVECRKGPLAHHISHEPCPVT